MVSTEYGSAEMTIAVALRKHGKWCEEAKTLQQAIGAVV